MRKTTAWVLFLALFVAYSNLTEAQTNTTLSRHATKIKHKVTKLGVGASVIVVRDSGPNVKGTIQAVEDSTFTVTVAYENVKQLDTYGTIVATGAKPHNPHKSLIIGACVLGGLIVFLAVALSDKKF